MIAVERAVVVAATVKGAMIVPAAIVGPMIASAAITALTTLMIAVDGTVVARSPIMITFDPATVVAAMRLRMSAIDTPSAAIGGAVRARALAMTAAR